MLQWDSTVYFVALTLSGIFSIIFSVAFAYVSDVTDEAARSLGYGLVTAGFAASLIISPALGAGLEMVTGREDLVIILASLTAIADVAFILFLVPESLDTKVNLKSLTFKQVLFCAGFTQQILPNENCEMAIAISSSRADSSSVPGVAFKWVLMVDLGLLG